MERILLSAAITGLTLGFLMIAAAETAKVEIHQDSDFYAHLLDATFQPSAKPQ